jgi:signal transduction histidine kinase/ligand-binding sensor domain-containing protein
MTRRLFASLVLAGLVSGSAFAQEAARARPQIGHDVWGLKDGVPEDIAGLAQTTDGYLWLGTAGGLFRFDGMRFEPFSPQSGPGLLSNNIYGVFAPSTGGLWIGYRWGGFSFLDQGRLTNFGGEAASSGSVHSFAQNRDGIVWADTSSGLWRFDRSRWEHVEAAWNAPERTDQIALDRSDVLWVLAGRTVLSLAPGAKRFEMAVEDLKAIDGAPDADFGIACDAEGFAVTGHSWLGRVVPGDRRSSATPLVKEYSRMVVDRAGGLWVAYRDLAHLWPEDSIEEALEEARFQETNRTTHDSILVSRRAVVERYDVHAYPYARLVDREGNVWFGTTTGLHRFYYKPFVQAASLPGAVTVASDGQGGAWAGGQDAPLCHLRTGGEKTCTADSWTLEVAYHAPDDTLWIGADSGLWRKRAGQDWVRIDLPSELIPWARYLQAITQDRAGGLWIALGRHGLYRLADGVWTPAGGRKDLPAIGIFAEFTDSLGRLWFGYQNNRLALLDGDQVRIFGSEEGLTVGSVLAIAGRGPDIWIGGEFGLQCLKDGRLCRIEATDDRMIRGVSGIIERAAGDLWLNTLSGVIHIDRPELSRALEDPSHRVAAERFGVRDGLPGFPAQLRPIPSAVEGADGRLWFAVNNGLVWLDPDHAQHRVPAPPMTIQSVFADDAPYGPDAILRFPPHTSAVQIGFVAVSLSAPESVRYRYKLEGLDQAWREVRTATPVAYRNLDPGTYRFNVGASDTNGAWSDELATVRFTLLPAFYQTAWFRLLCVLGAAGAIGSLFLLRVRQATGRVRAQMEARLGERERIARELHDTLLQSVQGLILKFQGAANRIPRDEPARQAIETTLDHADRVVAEGRQRVRDLRTGALPIDDLPAALQRVAEEDLGGSGAPIRIAIEGDARRLHPMVLEEAYAVGREALVNAQRHSGAGRIDVKIVYGQKQFHLGVRDDGRGIDASILEKGGRSNHFGLQGMRERARKIGARFDLRRRPGGGTEMEISVPASTAYRSADAQPGGAGFRRPWRRGSRSPKANTIAGSGGDAS